MPFEVSMTDGRLPVLAIGSNRAPVQLRRKFPDLEYLPLERVVLRDHDVVYAARVSGYGAMPATLTRSPGTCVDVAVTWLTPEQLVVMDASEGLGSGYFWADIPVASIRRETSSPLANLGCYVAARGVWREDGRPFALRAVAATGRRYAALSSREILARMARRLYPSHTFEDVLERLVKNAQFRAHVRARLGTMGALETEGLRGRPKR